MTQASLRSLTLQTLSNVGRAAELSVGTYRDGGHRLIALVQRGIGQTAGRGARRLSPRLAAVLRRISGLGDQVGGVAVKGLDAVSAGYERAISFGQSGLTTQVKRIAALADGIDNRVVNAGLRTAVRLSMPGARVAVAISERVAAGAETVHGKVAGVAPVAAKQAKTRNPSKPAAVVKVVKAVKAAEPVKTTRVRRAVSKPLVVAKAVVKSVSKPVAKPVSPARKAKSVVQATPAKAPRVRAAAKPKLSVPAASVDVASAAA